MSGERLKLTEMTREQAAQALFGVVALDRAMAQCWIDEPVPEGWRVEIKGSDGKVKPWNPARPIGPKVKYRIFDPYQPHGEHDIEWRVPGDYQEGTITRAVIEADLEALDKVQPKPRKKANGQP